MQVHQEPDGASAEHLHAARRVLALPRSASGLHYHPFGVYTIPMAKRTSDDVGGRTWSRRLHIWHPSATPVGEASAYGVHTHSGDAASHVLVGAVHHHLYAFEAEPDGIWDHRILGDPQGRATLLAHVQETTRAGMTHRLPRDQPHAVTKPDGLAISLFEQLDPRPGEIVRPFTTWTRTDVPEEPLIRTAPAALDSVRIAALAAIDAALYADAAQTEP